MQESLKGFHEERDKLQKSHVMQQAKEKAVEATSKVFEYGAKGVEMTKQGYSQVWENTAKVESLLIIRMLIHLFYNFSGRQNCG